MNTDQILAQLKDIHSPDMILWWPLAPGWFVLAILVFVLVVCFIYGYRRYRQKTDRRQNILQHLHHLRQNLVEEQYPLVYQDLSTLLRRIALLTHERIEVAHLTGEAWLQFLDEQCQTQLFSRDIGRLLLSAPYFPSNTQVVSPEPLLKITEEWIKRCT